MVTNMTTNVRLTKDEEKEIREKTININKLLINSNRMPMRESELIHAILKIGIRAIKIDEKGGFTFE